jgi:hypothetical protein
MLFKGKGSALGRVGIYLLWSVCFLQAAVVHCNERICIKAKMGHREHLHLCSLEPNIYDLTLEELQKNNLYWE